jgi:Ca2+-binding RTX toxin-like protein
VNSVVLGKAFSPTGKILVYGLDGHDSITIDKKIKLAAFVDGGEGNDTLKGGAGKDVLLGGAGSDQLSGGGGRNLLIGGADADVLTGGAKDDILIGGTTDHDDDGLVLDAIMAEWTGANPFATRLANLAASLNGTTVFDDAATDALTGGLGLDWFWSFGADTNDFAAGEAIN